VLALCALATAIAALVAGGPLDGMPHVSDEIVYTLQARLFAAGARLGPAADNASMMLYPFWETAPASFGIFPPGWPALLAAGERIGLGWLVNPLVAGALPWLTWLLAREASPRSAVLAAALAALSPGVWILAASRMSHTSVLAATLAVAVVVARGRDGRLAWLGAGLAAAYVVTARPYDALIVAGPLLALGLLRAPDAASRLPLVVLPGLGAALVLWDNAALTGSALTFPVEPWFDRWVADLGRPPGCNGLGFGADRGCAPTEGGFGHTPAKALSIGVSSLARLDRLLLGLHGGLVAALVGAWALRRPALLLGLALPVGAYALYWSPGLAYGARFYHLAYVVLPVLAAAGLHRLLGRWAWAVALGLPLATCPPILGDLSRDFWCVDGSLKAQLSELGIEAGVLFLDAGGERTLGWPALGVEALTCDPMLEAGDAFAWMDPSATTGGLQPRYALSDPARTRAYLDAHHPGAEAWVVEHDIAGDRRRISAVNPDGTRRVIWTEPAD